MTADHAGCRTRHVEQDAIERPAIPPVLDGGHVRNADLGVETEPGKILADPLDARPRNVQGRHLNGAPGALEHMAGLPSGGGAGVQHPVAGRRFEQVDRELGGGVLH